MISSFCSAINNNINSDRLNQFELFMNVDVIMCTWNSNKPWFMQCLSSIKNEIPICHYIVVDRFSKDDTIKVIKQFFKKAIIIESDIELGKARQEAIKHVDTEWFVFMDDDVELCSGWFKDITNCITEKTGSINGFPLPTLEWLRKFSLYTRKMAFDLRREWKVGRGIYLSNTIIYTNLVKDWSPPRFLSSGEDAHLSRHISNQGYDVIFLRNLQVEHHGKWGVYSAKKNLWHYSGIRLIRYTDTTTIKLIRRFLTSPLKGLYASLRLREPFIIPYLILSEYYNLMGWLQWNKNIVWKR